MSAELIGTPLLQVPLNPPQLPWPPSVTSHPVAICVLCTLKLVPLMLGAFYLGVCQAPVTHCTGRVSPEAGLQEQQGLMCQDCKGKSCGV
jgi:hypothetical protein